MVEDYKTNSKLSLLRPYIGLIVSVVFLVWYVRNYAVDFLFGLFIALPFSWLIVYLIFRKEKQRSGADALTVGKQLSVFTTTVASVIRGAAVIIFILGEFLFKQKLSVDTIMSPVASDGASMLALVYITLSSLVTELILITIFFDIREIFGKQDVYSENYNPKWKTLIAYSAIAFPFIVIGVLLWAANHYK
jgi:hypothetical protein